MPAEPKKRHFGIVTQVYPPDPAAVGQHLADVAEELGHQGHRVTVYTANRGYDDPSQRYPTLERNGNVTVFRLPFASFGKSSIALRLLGGASLVGQACALTVFDHRLTDLLLSTTPHFVGMEGIALKLLRALPFHYWLMDLNPDQIVAYGKIGANSLPAKAFDWLNRGILRHASTITTLDDAMARRFSMKSKRVRQIAIQPPWPIQDQIVPIDHEDNPFRMRFALTSERVIMHAGNHSPVHPLGTLVEAVRRHANSGLRYFFVGGGIGKTGIEQWLSQERPQNVTVLPYQPRDEVFAMLCAADVHVVSVGNDTVGIVHPSKIYGALAAGRPVLVLGPSESPAARLVREHMVGWQVEHGNIDGLVAVLDAIEHLPAQEINVFKQRAAALASNRFARQFSVQLFCARILGEG